MTLLDPLFGTNVANWLAQGDSANRTVVRASKARDINKGRSFGSRWLLCYYIDPLRHRRQKLGLAPLHAVATQKMNKHNCKLIVIKNHHRQTTNTLRQRGHYARTSKARWNVLTLSINKSKLEHLGACEPLLAGALITGALWRQHTRRARDIKNEGSFGSRWLLCYYIDPLRHRRSSWVWLRFTP